MQKNNTMYCEKINCSLVCKNITVVCRCRNSPEDFFKYSLEHIFRTMFLFSNRPFQGHRNILYETNIYESSNLRLPQKVSHFNSILCSHNLHSFLVFFMNLPTIDVLNSLLDLDKWKKNKPNCTLWF